MAETIEYVSFFFAQEQPVKSASKSPTPSFSVPIISEL